MVEKKELKRKLINVWNIQAGELVRKKEFTKARQLLIDEAYSYFKHSLTNTITPKGVYLCIKNTFDGWQEFCNYLFTIKMYYQYFPNYKQDCENFTKYIERFPIDFYILNDSKKIGAYLHLKKLYEKR